MSEAMLRVEMLPADHGRIAAQLGFAAMFPGLFMSILDAQIVVTSLQNIQVALSIVPPTR